MDIEEKNELLSISDAAKRLGVSIDTLRRWDKNGKLVASRKAGGTHRYYAAPQLEALQKDLLSVATAWVRDNSSIPEVNYCPNRAVFQSRLVAMEDALARGSNGSEKYFLIVALAGEIGNNSFDHNLGNWPDTPGIFFGFDLRKRRIVLADRGVGVLQTLRRVRPQLTNDTEALRLAFSETISGRAPEARGNGLKFVRKVVAENAFRLLFQCGDAELWIRDSSMELHIVRSLAYFRGCLASIEFPPL